MSPAMIRSSFWFMSVDMRRRAQVCGRGRLVIDHDVLLPLGACLVRAVTHKANTI